ncbi:NAD(P)H-dependent flavin oxidoreductase [Bacillus marasmi]|uniref:NAD(P)H-dependent flavin oxidoreductase n=1 Tax=Bacillus marasmi TaxID=1926279 RepID=UPI0011C78E76|nr:nitronate monooxygenase [Bacillus marasmi]
MSDKIPSTISTQLELPVISAPMFLVSSPEMVIAGCKAGIIGSFPLANARTEADLEAWMSRITSALDEAKRLEPHRKIAPWAVNLVVHRTNKRYQQDIKFIEKYQPPIVITSLGDPSQVVEIVHSYGGLVFSDVVNLVHAKKAAEKGTDGLILVCTGAGGHAGSLNPFAFISAVKEFWNGITILSGGISNGQDIAAAQLLGADLVYMGTRFIAVEESLASDAYRQMLVESTMEDVLYTDAFSGIGANYLLPSIERAGLNPQNLIKKDSFDWSNYKSENGPKPWKDIWSAGQGVGAIKRIETVAEVVEKLKEDYAIAARTANNA